MNINLNKEIGLNQVLDFIKKLKEEENNDYKTPCVYEKEKGIYEIADLQSKLAHKKIAVTNRRIKDIVEVYDKGIKKDNTQTVLLAVTDLLKRISNHNEDDNRKQGAV